MLGMALDRQMWVRFLSHVLHIHKTGFPFIPNTGLIQPPPPLGAQETKRWPEGPPS